MRSISFHPPKDIIKCHFALFSSRLCKSRNDPRNSNIVKKLFEKLNSVENRDREITFRFFETENREMGCHSRIENDFVEISTTLLLRYQRFSIVNIFLNELHWLPVEKRSKYKMLCLVYRLYNDLPVRIYMSVPFFRCQQLDQYDLRNSRERKWTIRITGWL